MKLEEVVLDEMEAFPLALVAKHRRLPLDWLLHAYSRQRSAADLWKKKGWRHHSALDVPHNDGKVLMLLAVQHELAYHSPEAQDILARISDGDESAWGELRRLAPSEEA